MPTFNDNPTYDTLRGILSELACKWRAVHDPLTVIQYNAVLQALLALGWNDNLDVDCELPDVYMLIQYKERHIQ